jgi:hypothetical protein
MAVALSAISLAALPSPVRAGPDADSAAAAGEPDAGAAAAAVDQVRGMYSLPNVVVAAANVPAAATTTTAWFGSSTPWRLAHRLPLAP